MESAEPLPDRATPVTQAVFHETYGSSLICCQLMLFLYGISVLQAYLYFFRFERDHKVLKWLVSAVMVLATIHTVLICHTVYYYDIITYTRPDLLLGGAWSTYASVIVSAPICVLVQLFFVRAVYHLTRGLLQRVLMVAYALLITSHYGLGLYLCVRLFQLWDLFNLQQAVFSAFVPYYTTRVASDCITALTMSIKLWGSRTGLRRSNRLIRILIIYAVNRFVLTTVVVLAQTLILIIRPQSLWAMVMDFFSVHLYVNSLLAALNSRGHLADLDQSMTIGGTEDVSRSGHTHSSLVFKNNTAPRAVDLRVSGPAQEEHDRESKYGNCSNAHDIELAPYRPKEREEDAQ